VHDIMTKLATIGLMPIMTIDDPDDAVKIGEALLKGGLPVAEVTFRTDAAEEAISRLAQEFPEILLGAGTVLTTEQADKASNAGASFCVAPGLNPKVVAHCLDMGFPIAPGICTPSGIDAAMEFGLDVVKFFPMETMGGLPNLKAVAAPYGDMRFIATGGIRTDKLAAYLSFDKVLACGGGWIAPRDLIAEGNFAEIENRAKEAVAIAKAAKS
jgi:2-dehydro-3-deoxyphosphogluconate aldolase/(4S)-4-hydroxy-2-oxoglutarate aldolase